jgi:hypothetical protein
MHEISVFIHVDDDMCFSLWINIRGLKTGWRTLAGDGHRHFQDGDGELASFNNPSGVAVNAIGDIIVADMLNHRIRAISPFGRVSTLAGNGVGTWADGIGTMASFYNPSGVAVNAMGDIIVADMFNHRIRAISPFGRVSTLAGNGVGTWADGIGTMASFNRPAGLAVTVSGIILIADSSNNRVRAISPTGQVSTIAGNGEAAWADDIGTLAKFNVPVSVAIAASGTIIADQYNHRIRVISSSRLVETLAGNGNATWADGWGSSSSFNYPAGVAVSSSGVITIADQYNNRIRAISLSKLVTSIAGNAMPSFADGIGTLTSFNRPKGVTFTASGDIVITDQHNHRIRQSLSYSADTGCKAGSSGRAPDCADCPPGFVCPGNAPSSVL